MNILILSVGTRNKIVQYFKKEFNGVGNVIATDMSKLAPAIYEADKYYIVPKITDKSYIDEIISICKKENINGVLSLIDPELSILAKNSDEFKQIGVSIIGSEYDVCERSLDKFRMFKWLESNNFNCAKTYINLEDFIEDFENNIISFPVFVKPNRGSASISISKVEDMETLKVVFNKQDGLIIQQFLNGQEIGIDAYIDMISGEVVSIFSKVKIKMRAGETDKSVSFKDDKLNELIIDFVSKFGFRGQIDIDVFDINGEYYISEVNPRFGGGYPHAYECGVNNIQLIKNNLEGKTNEKNIGNYNENIFMLKYNEIYIGEIKNEK